MQSDISLGYDELTVMAIEKVLKMSKEELQVIVNGSIKIDMHSKQSEDELIERALIILQRHPDNGHALIGVSKMNAQWMLEQKRKLPSLPNKRLQRNIERYEHKHGGLI